MKYFAELDENKKVIMAFVISDQIFEDEGMSLKSMNDDLLDPTHTIIEYSEDNSITSNRAEIDSTYDLNLNAFIPPQPYHSYILNRQTFEWEPNENIIYDLHDDGNLYVYNNSTQGWQITQSSEDKIIINLPNDKIELQQISLTDTL